MQFEAIKPARGRFPPAGDLFEDFVAVDAAIMANHPRGGVDEGNPCIRPPAGVRVDAKPHQGGRNQRYKPMITQQIGKFVPIMPTDLPQVKRLEVPIGGLMKVNQDRQDFTER